MSNIRFNRYQLYLLISLSSIPEWYNICKRNSDEHEQFNAPKWLMIFHPSKRGFCDIHRAPWWRSDEVLPRVRGNTITFIKMCFEKYAQFIKMNNKTNNSQLYEVSFYGLYIYIYIYIWDIDEHNVYNWDICDTSINAWHSFGKEMDVDTSRLNQNCCHLGIAISILIWGTWTRRWVERISQNGWLTKTSDVLNVC